MPRESLNMPSRAIATHLHKTSLFSDLSEQELLALVDIAVSRTFQAGDELFQEGDDCDGMYVIVSGSVRLYKVAASGREQVLSIEGPGDAVAELPVFDGGPYPVSARAMTEAKVVFLGSQKLRQLCLVQPALALKVLKVVGRRLRKLVTLIEELSFTTVRHRLIGFLLKRAQHNRQGNVADFALPESHQEIASQIGTVRELVSRNLSRLCAEGLIHLDGKHCSIPNLNVLCEEHEVEE